MYEFTCLNLFGEKIIKLTQWDKNQTLTVENVGLDTAPKFHFCNKRSTEAFVVPSALNKDGSITVDVPNELLTQPHAIIAYIYLSYTAVGVIKLPVHPRAKPQDFIYVENVEYVELKDLITEVEKLVTVVNETVDEVNQLELEAKENADRAVNASEKASNSADVAAESARQAKLSEQNSSVSESKAKTSETNAKTSETNAKASQTAAAASASNAKTSETNSKASETNAKASETKSKTSESNAKTSEENAENYAKQIFAQIDGAKESATQAAQSASSALSSMRAAQESQEKSAVSERNSKLSEEKSSASEQNSKGSMETAVSAASRAKTSETNASNSEVNSKASETKSKEYYDLITQNISSAVESAEKAKLSEVNAAESEINAKRFAEQAQQSAADLSLRIHVSEHEPEWGAYHWWYKVLRTRDVIPIRYIRDVLNGNSSNNSNHFVECKIFVRDKNIAKGIIPTSSRNPVIGGELSYYTDGIVNTNQYIDLGGGSSVGGQYLQLDLGESRTDIDYIHIWHFWQISRHYNHKLMISADGITWDTLFDSDVDGTYPETADGKIHLIHTT